MQISYNILKDFIKIPKSISPQEISDKLTNHTVEVEGFMNQAEKFSGVVVGKVLSVIKHPKADRLNLAEVDIKKEKLRIVCGAPNLEVGQLVPVATIGTVLPGDFEIKESEIRGEKSQGMICAEDELGLSEGHEGIMVLDKKAKVGQDFATYLKTDDIIFEVDNKSLSNRPDLLNHYGIARELSAIFELELETYDKFISTPELPESGEKIEVKVEDKELCPRYLALKIENIKIKESPAWLKERLIAIGQKPINNIVDISNYVMFEIGQPLHAFDAEKVNKINVRLADKNEKLETLDDKDRELKESDLVIADGKKILAIAGIIGGKDSAVNDKTTAIVLEAANFKDTSIRKTAQNLNIRTEASIRFEKALDAKLPELALKRFVNILLGIIPEAKISGPITEINNYKEEIKAVEFSFAWLEKKIGQKIDKDKALKQLSALGFSIKELDGEILEVTIPSWRATKDVKLKEDILEEVLRLYGYNNIESKLPDETLSLPVVNELRLFERKLKDFFALKHSLFEVYNYSFVGEEQLNKLEIDYSQHLKLANPLSENHSLLRQSLVPNLALNIKNNQFKVASLGFFEIANTFFNYPSTLIKDKTSDDVLPYQETKLGIALAGDDKDLFLKAKAIVGSLFDFISRGVLLEFLPAEIHPAWVKKDEFVSVVVAEELVGFVSILKKEVANKFGIKKNSVFIELSLKDLFTLYQTYGKNIFQEPSKYPAVERDLAFVVDEEIMYNDIKREISYFSDLIKSVELFDVYSGDKLEAGKKSLAFHLSYLSTEKTLTAIEVDALQVELMNHLAEKFLAKLRDF
ncbi:phenylalanine--tRNA ligase subunit beta [Candidatus Falkowbacteria bacterium]|nr:phenylalanine--tRNA ligase subunit beta [Candidatus Falkowbacteria bacterium]